MKAPAKQRVTFCSLYCCESCRGKEMRLAMLLSRWLSQHIEEIQSLLKQCVTGLCQAQAVNFVLRWSAGDLTRTSAAAKPRI
eukprot:5835451-Amphidinium_carterae.2